MTDVGMEFDGKTVGLWFLPIAETQDWMCMAREIEPDLKYEIVYRFRYYKDDKAFDSKDEKSWYRATVAGTRAFVIASLRTVARLLFEAGALHQPFEILNEGDFKQFTKKILDGPFIFARMETKPK